jgi:hypothetical protein
MRGSSFSLLFVAVIVDGFERRSGEDKIARDDFAQLLCGLRQQPRVQDVGSRHLRTSTLLNPSPYQNHRWRFTPYLLHSRILGYSHKYIYIWFCLIACIRGKTTQWLGLLKSIKAQSPENVRGR